MEQKGGQTELNKEQAKGQRMASIELLRSIAMLMVITLHYLDKGGILQPLTQKQGLSGYGAWLLESFSIVAVNTYVLVSGYFLVQSGFKLRRLITLAAQVLFYTVTVPLVLMLFGAVPPGDITVYELLFVAFPIQMNHYWFATAYILMYLLVPVLSAAVNNMPRVLLRNTILLLLLVFSVSKTVLPFVLAIDRQGYDVIWFICLFLIAAYIRLYGSGCIRESKKAILLYLAGCLLVFASAVCLTFVSGKVGKFAYFADHSFHYNNLFCLAGSVGLFLAFLYWKLPEGWLARAATRIAPYTFGVYLLHENVSLRTLWPQWLLTEQYKTGNLWPVHWVICIIMVFAAGICVDFVRSRIFLLIEKGIRLCQKNKK